MTFKKMFVALLIVHVAVLVACNKDKSFESKNQPPTDIGTGNNGNTDFGWTYSGNSVDFRGCIDTAYKETNQGATVLAIEGSDPANNAFLIAIGSPSANIGTGTYSETGGAGMILTDKEGNTFISKSFTIKITSISATEVTAEFSGSFSDDPATSNIVYTIAGGKLKAVIGGDTPCL